MVGGLPNSTLWNIDYEDLVFKEVIGKGNFGCVYRGSYLGVEVAIKQIPSFDDPDYCKYTEREIKALRYIRHPLIVHFFGACHHQSGFYLITEFIEGQDLRKFIKSLSKPPRWQIRIAMALSIAKTCFFLHSKGILHRDIKTKNVLLDLNFKTKLCDFGFVRMGSQYSSGSDSSSSDDDSSSDVNDDTYNNNGNGKPAKNRLRRMSICGTPSFMAPEILLQQKYDWSVDIFSYGILLAELITLKRPGKDFWVRNQTNGFDISVEELNQNIPTPNDCPTQFYDLCLKCCSYQSTNRPKFSDIIHILEAIKDSLELNSGAAGINNIIPTAPSLSLNDSGTAPTSALVNGNSGRNSTITVLPIAVFKERRRQSTMAMIPSKILRHSNSNNENPSYEKEGMIKLNPSQYPNGWREFGLDYNNCSTQKIWIIYQSNIIKITPTTTGDSNNQLLSFKTNSNRNNKFIEKQQQSNTVATTMIEITSGRIIKLMKSTLHIAVSDPNIINGVGIINIKPYVVEYPHLPIPSSIVNSIAKQNQNQLFWESNIDSIIKIQSLARRWLVQRRMKLFQSDWPRDTTMETKKNWLQHIQQLISNELEYQRQLDVILKSYLTPLQSKFRINKPLINYKEITSIFSNVESIAEIHHEFIRDVIQKIEDQPFYISSISTANNQPSSSADGSNPSPIDSPSTNSANNPSNNNNNNNQNNNSNNKFKNNLSISQYIIKIISQLKNIYGTYTFNFKYAMNTLSWCKLNPDFAKYLESVGSTLANHEENELSDLLSVPVNKIQKYLYIFEKLIQITPVCHSEYKDISAAYSLIRETSNYVQTQLEMSLEHSHIMSVETMVLNHKETSLVQSGRWFVRQGPMEDQSSKQKYYLFLLSDICLITKPIKSKSIHNSESNKKYYYRLKHTINLKDGTSSMRPNHEQPNGILLSIPDKVYKLIAINDEAEDWINDFERTIIINFRNNQSDHTKSLEDIFKNGGFVGGLNTSNSSNTPLSSTPPGGNFEYLGGGVGKEKNFIRRFRLSISGSPDRRASLANIPSQSSINEHPPLRSNLSNKKLKTTIVEKWKRLSVNFSSPTSESKKNSKDRSRD
eukprot:gene8403-10319_t